MTYVANPSAIVAIASGLAILSLGVAALVVGLRSRPPRGNRAPLVAFAVFLVAWGAQVAVANAANLAGDPDTIVPWAHANAVLMILLAEALAAVLLLFPRPRAAARHATTWILVALPGAVLLLLYAQQPDLMVAGASWSGDVPRLDPGPWHAPVGVFAVLGLFVVLLAVVARDLFTTRDDTVRRQSALVTAALLCYVAYKSTEVLTLVLPHWRAILAGPAPIDLVVVVANATAGAAAIAMTLWFAVRIPQTPWRELLILAGTLPAAAAIGEYMLASAGVVSVKTSGIWRLGSAALITYALMRFRLFDLDLRLWRAVPGVVYAALSALGLAVLWQWQGPALAQWPAAGAAASVGVVAMLVPAVRASRARVEQVLNHPRRREAQDLRRLEVYGAALAALGPKADDDPWLRRLRRQLGVTPSEHDLVAALAASPRLLNQGRHRALQPGDIVGGCYRAESPLSEGGHCMVHNAVDTRTGVSVVLKELRPEQRHDAGMRIRLAREITALEGLNHPHVVRLLDVVDEGGCPLLVLEHLTGGTLARLIAAGPVPPNEAAAITADVLAGLGRLHERNVVHRDMKPANVLLNASGRAKVADLGIALLARDNPSGLTQIGQQPGTLAYMSPEQARGEAIDHRSDLYSVGLILFEMVAGRHPWDLQGLSDTDARRVLQHPHPPPRLATGPRELDAVLRRALAADPHDRFTDAEAFRAALAPIQSESGEPLANRVPGPEPTGLPPTEVVAPTPREASPARRRTRRVAG